MLALELLITCPLLDSVVPLADVITVPVEVVVVVVGINSDG